MWPPLPVERRVIPYTVVPRTTTLIMLVQNFTKSQVLTYTGSSQRHSSHPQSYSVFHVDQQKTIEMRLENGESSHHTMTSNSVTSGVRLFSEKSSASTHLFEVWFCSHRSQLQCLLSPGRWKPSGLRAILVFDCLFRLSVHEESQRFSSCRSPRRSSLLSP